MCLLMVLPLGIPCFPPPDIPHGTHSGRYEDDFTYGTVVTYTCEDGYPLLGDAHIHCTSKDGFHGEWSGRAYCGGELFSSHVLCGEKTEAWEFGSTVFW